MEKKKKVEVRGHAVEIPPRSKNKIRALDSATSIRPKSKDILLKERDAVMTILKYLNTEPQVYPGQHDSTKYFSLKKVLDKFSHIKNIKSLISLLMAEGYIQKSTHDDGISISSKGSKFVINKS